MDEEKVRFEVTEEHVKLFRELSMYPSFCVGDAGDLEIRPSVDWKRPFGNDGVTYDACRVLGYIGEDGSVPPGRVLSAMLLIAQLPVAVECFARHGKIAPGAYEITRYGAYFHYKNVAMAIFWKDAIETCSKAGLDAEKAAEFAANTPARRGNPYSLLKDMEAFFSGTEENRRILRIFEDEAVKRYEIAHGHPGHDRAAILVMLKDGTAGMSWPGWPFCAGRT